MFSTHICVVSMRRVNISLAWDTYVSPVFLNLDDKFAVINGNEIYTKDQNTRHHLWNKDVLFYSRLILDAYSL